MLSVLFAVSLNGHEQSAAGRENDSQTDVHINANNIQDGKYYQQSYQSCREINNVLCLDAFEFNATIDPFINIVYGCHCLLLRVCRTALRDDERSVATAAAGSTSACPQIPLYPEETFEDRGDDYQKNATAKPRGGGLGGVGFPGIPFVKDLDRPDQPHNRPHRIK